MYYWIKNKLIRFKKWLVILICGATILAAPIIIPDAPVETPATPDSLTVKIDKLKDKDFIKSIRETDSVIIDGSFTKTYKAKEKRLTIESSKDLIDIQLLSSYHRMIGAGDSVLIAEFKLKDWKKKDKIFDYLEFFNKKEYTKEDKQFVYKYCEEKTIQMELPTDFPEEASDNEMFEKVIGDWGNAIEFTTLDELPHKDIRIGIFTKTVLNEKIEWLPTIDGFDIYEWAAYDVTEIDSLEHDTFKGTWHSLVMIDSTHFILAYAGDGDDGFIKTFSIDGSHNITQIDSLEHDTTLGGNNSLVMIDSTHFILAYKGADNDGFIKTFSIDGSHNITQIDSLEHDTTLGGNNSLVMIDSTHFILAYKGADNDGFIKTFSIDGSYAITQESSLEHDIVGGYGNNSLVKIDSTHFMLARTEADDDGFIKVFSINGSYEITQESSLEHDTVNGESNSLVKIDSTHFILAYQGSGDDGFIKTFSMEAGGAEERRMFLTQ